MRRYFADAFYWVALFSPRDQWHSRVLAFEATLDDTPLYTTDEVLTEFLAFYSAADPVLRTRAAIFVETILQAETTTVMPQTHAGFLEAFAQFLAVCSRSKWSRHLTKSPLLALLATAGSNAAYKIISACSNAVS